MQIRTEQQLAGEYPVAMRRRYGISHASREMACRFGNEHFVIFGFTNSAKSRNDIRISSLCVPALNAIISSSARLSATITSRLKRLPNGGIAPTSQPGKRSLNCCSPASSTCSAFMNVRREMKSTMCDAGTTTMIFFSSAVTITVLAISFPGILAIAAISSDVYAGECWITMYLIFRLSRNSFNC